ncbi:MAG: DUF433 domain-containing protein [Bacteroidota bacterium]
MENAIPNSLLDRITTNPKVMLGKPTIRGTRLTVEQILNEMASGLSFEDLKEDFPFLEPEDLQACTMFALHLEREKEWWETIGEQNKALIYKSLKQANDGELIPHDVVRQEINRMLGKS